MPLLMLGMLPVAALLLGFRSCAVRQRGAGIVVASAAALTFWAVLCVAQGLAAFWNGYGGG